MTTNNCAENATTSLTISSIEVGKPEGGVMLRHEQDTKFENFISLVPLAEHFGTR